MKPTQIHGFISDRDIMIAVTSNIIGVPTLMYPRLIAQDTSAADGWLAIVLGGSMACILAWILAKITSSFPNQNFLSFASYLLSKPVSVVIAVLFLLQFIVLTSYNVREITVIAHQYLFDRTPIEVISLSFLLVVIYAVSGSRAGIFRLNIIFFPITIWGLLILILLPLGLTKLENLLPIFQTDFQGYLRASYSSFNAFLGFGIVLFYISIVKEPKKTPKMTVLGVLIAVLLYLLLFIICIGTFGNATTANLFFPSFELSKTVELPGGFFERFDSILFVIWTIAIFTTALMSFDIVIMIIMMLFKKAKKLNIIFVLSPIIFILSMLPKDYIELIEVGKYLGMYMFSLVFFVTVLLGIAYKMKGGNQS